jgi:hypothetical protein
LCTQKKPFVSWRNIDLLNQSRRIEILQSVIFINTPVYLHSTFYLK